MGSTRSLHEKYCLTRIINGNGKMTKLAGAVVLPEILEQVTEAMQCFFDIDELQERAGEMIVRATGAEAGCVTACTAAGIALSVAGTMTGADLGKVSQLPDTRGMKSEIVLQKGHAVNFGAPITQMIRLAGATPIEVGTVNGASEHDIRHAISENTAAIVFTISHHTTRYGCVPLKRVVEIAYAHSLPVIVDGAAQSFLIREIVATGADLVICSGHKYLSGTTAGVVCGKADLIRAVALQNRGIGRPMKVGKEGIVGVMASLENRIKTDVDAWEAEQNRKMNLVIDRLQDTPGVHLSVDPDPNGNPFSRAKVFIESGEAGISSAVVCAAMAGGDPSISLRCHHTDEGYFHVDTIEMSDEEVALTCDRLEGILKSSEAEKAQLAEGYARSGSDDHRKVWLS
jgi:L-seryl-tRNA(Ser) seleniumtransferase